MEREGNQWIASRSVCFTPPAWGSCESPRAGLDTVVKSNIPDGNWTQVVQPEASRYTDRTVTVHGIVNTIN
jgi:hypothetical protein